MVAHLLRQHARTAVHRGDLARGVHALRWPFVAFFVTLTLTLTQALALISTLALTLTLALALALTLTRRARPSSPSS